MATTFEWDSDLHPHYDFRGGTPGKYSERFGDRATVVLLEPDVAEAFPDAFSVNEAPRKLIAERSPARR